MSETLPARKVRITKPSFGESELQAVQAPLESGWVVQGPQVARFEELVAEFVGVPSGVATSSGTAALHVAVAALGLGPQDEVIVPAFTWISTANVVEFMGARPVFCDVDLTTFNIDPAAVASAVTPRTVGIIPVHLFGLCADLDPILGVAREHGLWVIEDAACALGSFYRGVHAGALGDAGCFSFHPRKSITTGEGGMVVTARPELAAAAFSLRDHGSSRATLTGENGTFLANEYALLGYNYRLTDIQAALGCAQMERVTEILRARRNVAAVYDSELAELDWLSTPAAPADYVHGYQAYVCLFRQEEPSLRNVDALNARRNALMATLREQGIETRQGTHAAAFQRYYAEKYGFRRADFPNAYLAEHLSLALPLHAELSEDDLAYVLAGLRDAAP